MRNQTCPENKENTTSKIRSAARMLITATLAFGALALSSLTGASITCAEAQTVAPVTRQSGSSSELGFRERTPSISYDWSLLSPMSPLPQPQNQPIKATMGEMLEGMFATRYAQEAVVRFADVLEQPGLDALTRLNAFFSRARQIEIENAPNLRAKFDALAMPENIAFNQRINEAAIKAMAPVLARIIEQGKTEGRFNVSNSVAAAETVLQLAAGARDAMAHAIKVSGTAEAAAASEVLENRLRFQGNAISRVLGLPDESIVLVDPSFTQAIMAIR